MAGTAPAAAADASAVAARVILVEGEAQARAADGTSRVLAVGDALPDGATVVTGPGALLQIAFVDGTVFRLGPETSLALDEVKPAAGGGAGSLLVSILEGVFVFVTGSIAGSGPDAMQVTTPGGTIGIRGTTVGCTIAQGDGSTACVLLPDADGGVGRVAFRGASDTVVLDAANEAVVSSGGGSAVSVQRLDPLNVQSLLGDVLGGLPPLEPEAGPERTGRDTFGGNASFAVVNFGAGLAGLPLAGLDPTGVLGATSLEREVSPLESSAILVGSETERLVLTPTAVTAAVASLQLGPRFTTARPLPDLAEGSPLPPGPINGVDPTNLALAAGGSAEVELTPSTARFANVVGFYRIAEDGSLLAPEILIADTRAPGGPVTVGDLPPGTQLGLFLIADGARLNAPELLASGELRFLAADGGPARVGDGQPPQLVHVAEDGTVTPIVGPVYHTADGDPADPLLNSLNPDGREHVVSGFATLDGALRLGFEDLPLAAGGSDGDFNDVVVEVRLQPDEAPSVVTLPLGIDAAITPPEGRAVGGLVVRLGEGARAGDRLLLADHADLDGDGRLDGTGLRLLADGSDGRLAVAGVAAPDVYEDLIEALRLSSTADPVPAGSRTLAVTLLDDRGGTLASANLTLALTEPVRGGPEADRLQGTAASELLLGGDGGDRIAGGRGDDILLGEDGADLLLGEDGNDLLVGGLGADRLAGGAGADRFQITSLADRLDTILDFDRGAGDRLDLDALLDRSPGSTASIRPLDGAPGDFVVEVDLDGAGTGSAPIGVVVLDNPTGVSAGTDLSALIS